MEGERQGKEGKRKTGKRKRKVRKNKKGYEGEISQKLLCEIQPRETELYDKYFAEFSHRKRSFISIHYFAVREI